jgi:hypothetical protein
MTAEANHGISRVIGNIRDESTQVSEKMARIRGEVVGLGAQGTSARGNLDELLHVAERLRELAHASTSAVFVETEKINLLTFIGKVWQTVAAGGGQDHGSFENHHTCPLGMWYYEGEGRNAFSHLPGFRELEAPHIRLHRLAADAVRHAGAGAMEQAVAAATEMREAYDQIVSSLDRLLGRAEEGDDGLTLF